jgi:hypothetical protein
MGTTIARWKRLTIHANVAFIAAIYSKASKEWRYSCWRAVDCAEHYEVRYGDCFYPRATAEDAEK